MSSRSGLSIAAVAGRTGISAPTLRAWEARYGFPRPQRLASGHRRYSERDCEVLLRVLAERRRGASVRAAIDRALADTVEAPRSVFAELRRGRPDVMPHLLSKGSLLALSRAIEDEWCARAERGVLLGCFQRERFYRRTQARWRELARTAREAIVFADFPAGSEPADGPAELPLTPATPLLREWVVVCDAPGFAACLVGWERAGREATDVTGQFEAFWTIEPDVVRRATLILLRLADDAAPDLADRARTGLPAPAAADAAALRTATALTNRMVAALEATQRRRSVTPARPAGS